MMTAITSTAVKRKSNQRRRLREKQLRVRWTRSCVKQEEESCGAAGVGVHKIHNAAAAAPGGQEQQSSLRENWERWGCSNSEWLPQKTESEETTEEESTY